MAENRAVLIIQSGENKLFVIMIISYAWSHMAQQKLIKRSQLLEPMAAQTRTKIHDKFKEKEFLCSYYFFSHLVILDRIE